MKEQVKDSFRSRYNKEAAIVVKAPGRINLIGEHTDYNAGLVLPAAIDRYMYFAIAPNDSNRGVVYAKDLDEQSTIDFDNLKKTDSVWVNYLIGLLIEFNRRNISLKGFDCVFSSDIPMGGGMSSSAALECGFAVGMNHINRSKLSKWEMIDMSHNSNHDFMNIYGGIMDQFSSLFGKKDKCMLLQCKDRSFEYYDMHLSEHSIVLINTNVKHEHTSSGYNDRSAECTRINELLLQHNPQIKNISEINLSTIQQISDGWPEHLVRRASFVVSENGRVVQFREAMKNGEVEKMGALLYQSHFGLQQLFEVSCPELDLLVDLTRDIKEVIGARMMGGGFGGCTINLIKTDRAKEAVDVVMREYSKRIGIEAECYFVEISDGASVIEL